MGGANCLEGKVYLATAAAIGEVGMAQVSVQTSAGNRGYDKRKQATSRVIQDEKIKVGMREVQRAESEGEVLTSKTFRTSWADFVDDSDGDVHAIRWV